MTTAELREHIARLHQARTPFVLATVVRAERPTSARPGDSAVVLSDGSINGFVGGVCAESTVRLEGLRLLRSGQCELLRVTPHAGDGGFAGAVEGMRVVENPCLSGGTLEIFLETVLPPPLIEVFGDSPIARAMLLVGESLRYEVRTLTDPATPPAADTTALVVAAHGREEEAVLRGALAAHVPYIALVASPKRSSAVLGALDDVPGVRTRVSAPAGLDIGARTPEEIALSIYAEIISSRPAAVGSERPVTDGDTPSTPGVERRDPVCGMAVAATGSGISATSGGRTWYFCGTGCRDAYLADPTRYRNDLDQTTDER
jgi:xanthine dehydrogenase accessory factor